MKSALKTTVGGLLAALFLTPALTPAADWPQWRGPARDGRAPADKPLPRTLAPEAKQVWRTEAGPGLSSPVVAGGRVVAFDNQDGKETLRLLAADTGKELWRTVVDEPFSDSQGPTGPRCTPMIEGDRIYAVSCRGELQCRRVQDGALIWRANYVQDFGAVFIGEKGSIPGAARHGNNGTPVIHGELLIANAGGTNGAAVVAFDKRTGAVRWKSQGEMAGYAAPVVARPGGVEQVISFTAEGGLGLAADDGRFLWRFPIKTAFARHVMTPVVLDDLVVIGSHQAGMFGLKLTPAGTAQEVMTAWSGKEAAVNFSSPVLVGEHLYGLGPRKDIFCLEVKTGAVKWQQTGVVNTSADKAYASFLVLGDRILTLTDQGELVLFAASPSGYEEFGRQQVAGANWCNPAYADGRLYLRDARQWLCVELAK